LKEDMLIVLRWFKYVVAGFCLAVFFSMRVFGAEGPVPVEGVIKKDATWSGMVLVAGDVLVPEGVTLTIAPGTKVMFSASESSKIEPMFLSMQTELLIRGILKAEGEPGRPVSFGPAPEGMADKKPQRGDWGGVIFDGEASSGSIISNAVFIMGDQAIAAYHASPRFSDCRVEDSRYGIVCAGGSSPDITRSVVTGCEFGLVSVKGSKPALHDCKVEKNEHDFLTRE
jgi:hypothetical protein